MELIRAQNNSMEFNRQIFTLFHELAHIVLKQSYLDVFDDYFWNLEYSQEDHIEVKCNAFASEFLVPTNGFIEKTQNHTFEALNISDLAKSYNVSQEVILRKLFSIGQISEVTFSNQVQKIQKQYEKYLSQKKSSKSKSGGDFFNNQISYLGNSFLSLVIKKYNQRRLTIEEASEHLNLKVRSFLEIEDRFLSRREFV